MVRLQKKKPCWEKFTNNFFEGVLKINNNNNKKITIQRTTVTMSLIITLLLR